ncbi:MAG TPA: GNAT family N-acetyltransferase [Mucilaginibacter sp.]
MTGLTANDLNISIKRIAVNEVQFVVNLFDSYRVFYKKQSDLGLAERFLKDRLANNESVIFVAFIDETPVAFTQLYPKYSSANAIKNWILNDLFVNEQYRKQGIGKQLIDTAIDFAKNNDAKYVQLETAIDNYNAQHLYEAIGFLKQGPDTEFLVYRINVD